MVLDVAFAPEGFVAASVAWDGEVRVWNASGSFGEIAAWPGAGPVAFSPDGTMLASADEQRHAVAVRPVDGGQPQLVLPVVAPDDEWGVSGSVVFSPDGDYVATTTFPTETMLSSLTLWDTTSGTAQATLLEHPFLRGNVAFSDDGSRIAAGSCEFPIGSR